MDLGEQEEANKGYVGHPNKVKCPQNVGNLVEKWMMQGRVRAHHKMLNGLGFMRHGDAFWAFAVVTQLTIKDGEPLFEVEYEDL